MEDAQLFTVSEIVKKQALDDGERGEQWIKHFPQLSRQGDFLIHGDAHPGNVLQSNAGWSLIDPKGLIGSREADLGVLMSHWKREFQGPDASAVAQARCSFIANATGTSQEDIWDWGILHNVQLAFWCYEYVGSGSEMMAIAEAKYV